jgi:GntR family transcriptional regulator
MEIVLPDLEDDTRGHLHERVARAIRSGIASGELPPGARIAGENDLISRYGISRSVARQALDTLTEEGLIMKRPKVGTFVRERANLRRFGMDRYHPDRWDGAAHRPVLGTEASAQGIAASRALRFVGKVAASNAVADRLGIATGTQVLARYRVVALDGRVVQLADSYYPLEVADRTQLHLDRPGAPSDLPQLAAAGHTPTRVREEWLARMPNPRERDLLGLAKGTPVLQGHRTIYDQDGTAAETMETTIAADSTELVYDFDVPGRT